MTERPILFNAEMVRAILDGRKTQTRRVVKPQPLIDGRDGCWYPHAPKQLTHTARDADGRCRHYANEKHLRFGLPVDFCPYGQPGDRLWVRETWLQLDSDHRNPEPDRSTGEGDRGAFYKASYDPIMDHEGDKIRREYGYKWRPSIHMPRWASRITLEVKAVRVERVDEITENDAEAEGFKSTAVVTPDGSDYTGLYASEHFAETWDRIYAKKGFGWETGPWVWVIEFEKVQT